MKVCTLKKFFQIFDNPLLSLVSIENNTGKLFEQDLLWRLAVFFTAKESVEFLQQCSILYHKIKYNVYINLLSLLFEKLIINKCLSQVAKVFHIEQKHLKKQLFSLPLISHSEYDAGAYTSIAFYFYDKQNPIY